MFHLLLWKGESLFRVRTSRMILRPSRLRSEPRLPWIATSANSGRVSRNKIVRCHPFRVLSSRILVACSPHIRNREKVSIRRGVRFRSKSSKSLFGALYSSISPIEPNSQWSTRNNAPKCPPSVILLGWRVRIGIPPTLIFRC